MKKFLFSILLSFLLQKIHTQVYFNNLEIEIKKDANLIKLKKLNDNFLIIFNLKHKKLTST